VKRFEVPCRKSAIQM